MEFDQLIFNDYEHDFVDNSLYFFRWVRLSVVFLKTSHFSRFFSDGLIFVHLEYLQFNRDRKRYSDQDP